MYLEKKMSGMKSPLYIVWQNVYTKDSFSILVVRLMWEIMSRRGDTRQKRGQSNSPVPLKEPKVSGKCACAFLCW